MGWVTRSFSTAQHVKPQNKDKSELRPVTGCGQKLAFEDAGKQVFYSSVV